MTTAPNASAALSEKTFRVYSDLLLHDMGPELADICAPGSTPSEWKTARLVGLGHRSVFLHNGLAHSVENAILLHGGEAAPAKARYEALNQLGRQLLLGFLASL